MAVDLEHIVPWGRSWKEYEQMFSLGTAELSHGVLDCGGGPASFTAEVSACNYRAVAADPIYRYSGAEIRARFEATADSMLAQVRATPADWVWSYHREVRVFPLLTLGGKPSPHLAAVRSALRNEGWASEVVAVDYELQRGGNQMLRVFRE